MATRYLKSDAARFFLKRVSEDLRVSCTGLEFNAKARAAGVFDNILGHSIQVYAAHHPESVDMVCTFQVLEHVYDVKIISQCMLCGFGTRRLTRRIRAE